MKKTIASSGTSTKPDRKTIERDRRIHMKRLCFKLTNLIPSHFVQHSKDILSQPDQLDIAATYIKQLKERIEELKSRKNEAMENSDKGATKEGNNSRQQMMGFKLPVIELRDLGSTLDVMLVSGLKQNFMLYDVIRVLEEEGNQVVSASFSTVGDKVFYSLHAQAIISRVGVETTRVYQRLEELIQ
ncbi:transcription factor bHLH162-like isoform X2 [Malania oleifera]|uniref:transcription factor bHLH162-like isoform X2 n=1 Tax=Malania oleifera TaxID=397392 RepID=UPI0025ADD116|nr:transcription factor bHLH162-like isoform X2 [Malania oleifera]